jgi:anti-sigma factor RsiW
VKCDRVMTLVAGDPRDATRAERLAVFRHLEDCPKCDRRAVEISKDKMLAMSQEERQKNRRMLEDLYAGDAEDPEAEEIAELSQGIWQRSQERR